MTQAELNKLDAMTKMTVSTPREDILRLIGETFDAVKRQKVIELVAKLESSKRGGGSYLHMASDVIYCLDAANWNPRAAKAMMIQCRIWG